MAGGPDEMCVQVWREMMGEYCACVTEMHNKLRLPGHTVAVLTFSRLDTSPNIARLLRRDHRVVDRLETISNDIADRQPIRSAAHPCGQYVPAKRGS